MDLRGSCFIGVRDVIEESSSMSRCIMQSICTGLTMKGSSLIIFNGRFRGLGLFGVCWGYWWEGW